MTATCTLCGQVITAEPDGLLDAQRDDRLMGRMGGMFRAHLEKLHAKEEQAIFGPPIMQGGSIAHLIAVAGITSQSIVLYSYLLSTDPVYLQKLGQMRQIVEKAMEQKAPKPAVALS